MTANVFWALSLVACGSGGDAHPEYEITFDIAVVGIDESESLLSNDPELAADVMQLPPAVFPS